jgi:pantetheine-phosphate adenylyltransferase
MINAEKNYMFSLEQRKRIAEAALGNRPKVKVISSDGMLWALAKELSAVAIVKGVRNEIDLAYEEKMAEYNAAHYSAAETVLLPAKEKHLHISSTLVRTKILAREDLSDLLLENAFCIFFGKIGISFKNISRPFCVRGKLGYRIKISAREHCVLEQNDLFGESCGENCKSHNLNKPDIFLFNVMERGARVEYSKRTLLARYVVAKHQIAFVSVTVLSCDGSYGIVRNAVGVGVNACTLVCVFSPIFKYVRGRAANGISVG